jgi:hypothetical protein
MELSPRGMIAAVNCLEAAIPMQRQAKVNKRILDPGRVRQIPSSFSWIDRRFVREEWIDRLGRDEILLYLFLVTVADRWGLSFYSDQRITSTLKFPLDDLKRARDGLLRHGLIAYEAPLYQVLSLARTARPTQPEALMSIGEILRSIAASPPPSGGR